MRAQAMHCGCALHASMLQVAEQDHGCAWGHWDPAGQLHCLLMTVLMQASLKFIVITHRFKLEKCETDPFLPKLGVIDAGSNSEWPSRGLSSGMVDAGLLVLFLMSSSPPAHCLARSYLFLVLGHLKRAH